MTKNLIKFLSAFLLFGVISCAAESLDDGQGTESSESETGSNVACSGSANYTVTFTATWSAETHPTDFPSNPHFSRLVGGTHNSDVTFWESGEVASQGIEDMAELGQIDELFTEIASAIDAGTANSQIEGGRISVSPGSVSVSFEMQPDFPLVTLVTMLAPSPDWFVGVRGLNLCVDGEWVDATTSELYVYDAGTDSGTTYTSADADVTPHENISLIEEAPFLVNGEVVAIGTFEFSQ